MKKYILALLFCTTNFELCTVNFSLGSALHAQCPVENTAFQSGERLEYKLYFNWKFIWKNAGTATMTTRSTTHKGKPAFQSDLITRTSGRIDRWFQMRDTLHAVYTPQMVPLYYRKGANEGGKYRSNEIYYTYSGGQTRLHQRYRHGDGRITEADNQTADCAYDMLSMMMRARSYRASDFQPGQRIPFLFADGDRIKQQTLVYRGIKQFTTEAQPAVTYRCLVFSYLEKNSKGREKEVVTFYVTDDDNHIPVRLDLYLRFGVAKAYLRTASGLRNPETSIVE